jgi:hypothetical protein
VPEVPSEAVTTTFASFAEPFVAGTVQVIEVVVWLPTTGQFTPSTVTVAPVAPKFAPVITMFVPPAISPLLGDIEEIDGRIEEVKLSVVKLRPPMVQGTTHRTGWP